MPPHKLNHVRAEEIWPGETCFIVGGGPSLLGFDFSKLAGKRVIAINSSVFSVPTADVLFFGDYRWWSWNGKKVLESFPGKIFTGSEASHPRVMNLVKRAPDPLFLSTERGEVVMQRTSLTAAMNLAVHFGCRRLILLGADQQAAPDGRTHHHDAHPVRQVVGCWDRQLVEIRKTATALKDMGVEVINTSLESRIDWWPKRSIDEVLDGLEHGTL